MFAFDHWADWLKSITSDLNVERFSLIRYHDSRPFPEMRSNPSFGLSLDSKERIGYIGFWKNGLCDYNVIDVPSDSEIATEAGLDATDETVPILFAKFMSFYE